MKKMILLMIMLLSFTAIKANADDISYIKGAKSGILIEETTNTILYEKNIHDKLAPASMTKIMTMLLTFEAINQNVMSFDTMLTTSEYAASMGGTQVYLKVGEKISVDEALKCVAIASANDCAVLLGEYISGSEIEFVKQMNSKAKELGANNTNFTDCTGLNEENHYTTSYDLALISRDLIMNYPKVFDYTNSREDYIRKDTSSPFWLVNTNKLIGNLEEIKGLKTGHTSFAGYCITLYMKKDNISLISVVFGYDTAPKRNAESLELLRYGANNYKLNCIMKKGTVIDEINHILYKDIITITINEDISTVTKKNKLNAYSYDYKFDIISNSGKLIIMDNNIKIMEKEIIKENMVKKSFLELIISLFEVVIG